MVYGRHEGVVRAAPLDSDPLAPPGRCMQSQLWVLQINTNSQMTGLGAGVFYVAGGKVRHSTALRCCSLTVFLTVFLSSLPLCLYTLYTNLSLRSDAFLSACSL